MNKQGTKRCHRFVCRSAPNSDAQIYFQYSHLNISICAPCTFTFNKKSSQLTIYSFQFSRFCHFRIRERFEVDFVSQAETGQVVGIEVKAGATVRNDDFRGLRRLQEVCKNFVMGIVLYDDEHTLPFGDQMYAVPISTLWSPFEPTSPDSSR